MISPSFDHISVDSSAALTHVITALGYLDDVEDDEALGLDRAALTSWFTARQVRLITELSRQE